MKAISFFLGLCFLTHISYSQNLIVNGDFELSNSCPTSTNQWHLLQGWNNVNLVQGNYSYGTPDYYDNCGSGLVSLPYSFLAELLPFSGDGCAGLVIFNNDLPDYREYLSSMLSEPLVVGEVYDFEIHICGGSNQTYHFNSDQFGIEFSVYPLSQAGHELIQISPTISINDIQLNSAQWRSYTATFTADSAYNYITLGNFLSDVATNEWVTNSNSIHKYSNVYVDDIILLPKSKNSINKLSGKEQQILSLSTNGIFRLNKQVDWLKVFNLNGQTVQTFTSLQAGIGINLTQLPVGVYSVQAMIGNEVIVQRVIVN